MNNIPDSQKLKEYFNGCLETGRNVCIMEDDRIAVSLTSDTMRENSTSTSYSTNASTANETDNEIILKFSFLCGSFEKKSFIYGVKFAEYEWHYFEEADSPFSKHFSLPASMDISIGRSDKVRSIVFFLTSEESKNYFRDGKFMFKDKELKTCT